MGTISLRTVERANGYEIELNRSELVLVSSPPDRSDAQTPQSTFPFSIPLPPDTPQCIHTPHSAVSHTLTARLVPAQPGAQAYTKELVIHTRRYTSHSYALGIAPETKAIDDPTRVEVQVPRTSFKAGEPIPLYLTIPSPRRELVLDEGLRLRNVRAELIRLVKVKKADTENGPSSSRQSGVFGSIVGESSQASSSVQKQHSLSSSHALDMRSLVGVPGGGEVVALSGTSCRLHPTRPLHLRLVLHQPRDDDPLSNQSPNLHLSDASHQEVVTECTSITQTTLLHSVSFLVCIHVTFMHMGTHTERVSTISIPVNILPPSAPLPEVEESLDTAYRKKHDRPPTRTARHEDAEVPHYEEGVAGPSFHAQGAPPPFEEREAPPPFFSQAPEASTSRPPTFLESETEIYVPSQEDQSIAPLPLAQDVVFEGEGVLFGFSHSEQFDGYNQLEEQDRPMTPPPTLEEATRDPDVTELATLTETDAINALELALEQHPDAPDAGLPPPPPIDDSDPPPSIDSEFTSPSRHHTASPPHSQAPPAFAEPSDSGHHPPPSPLPTNAESPSPAHGHAPPPYRVPDNSEPEDQENVARPPPYVD
ncbi:unnamed protein product [Somion occarium]|uniref:Arrestin C-terminal-like domain-containing protein n=1 Tax=Somion occarium TaxID=3059160 RepID=A0ABP1CK44_9APHY